MVDQDQTESLALAPQPGRWRTAPRLFDSSTSQLKTRQNKASMFVKTKDEYKMSSWSPVPVRTSRPFSKLWASKPFSRLRFSNGSFV